MVDTSRPEEKRTGHTKFRKTRPLDTKNFSGGFRKKVMIPKVSAWDWKSLTKFARCIDYQIQYEFINQMHEFRVKSLTLLCESQVKSHPF